MGSDIKDYGLIGDMRTAALVSRSGSIDWLCWPDFDSEACFASLIGASRNGHWLLAPRGSYRSHQRYCPGTNVLETVHRQSSGAEVCVTDFMPVEQKASAIVRVVRGLKGKSKMRTVFAPRFDYGSAQPRIDPRDAGCWDAVAGPNRITLRSNIALETKKGDLVGEWTVREGESSSFSLQHTNSFLFEPPPPLDIVAVEQDTVRYWQQWIARSTYRGPYNAQVERSLLALKAMTYAASGGLVAAPTTSLPEKIGGTRNWDYRFCWLRDSTFSLLGMELCGFHEDARAWLGWLARSLQGRPESLKIMYGVSGKREHSEWVADWLCGYKNSRPVHIGNKASGQLQLDTFGEILDALYRARKHGLYPDGDQGGSALELPLLLHLEKVWRRPDAGLWEFRSGDQQFTQSDVMAWVAFDRGIRIAEEFGMEGPVDRWRALRDRIHKQVCNRGFNRRLNSFTQTYHSRHMDASLLLLPIVGFLPAEDPRMAGTVRAIERSLRTREGFLLRYNTHKVKDGLPAGEGAFLASSFWLVDVYVLQGRLDEARALFEKLLSVSNEVGLLSEEYDSRHGLVGNFPQAFTHIGLINAALSLNLQTSARLAELR